MVCIKKFVLFVFLISVFGSCREKKIETTESILQKTGKVTKIIEVDNLQFAWELMSSKKYHEMLTTMKIPFEVKESKLDKKQYALLLTLIDLKTGELISGAEITVYYLQEGSTIKTPATKLKKLSGAGMQHYGTIIPLLNVEHLTVIAKTLFDEISYSSKISF